MPAIRDGRGKLVVHDMGAPPGNPSGPIERTQASAARMADFAAERAAAAEPIRSDAGRIDEARKRGQEAATLAASRARGAARAGFVKGATKPKEDGVPPREHHDAGSGRIREQVAEGKAGAGSHWARKRAEKAERVFAALRDTPGYEQAAERLKMSRSALEGLVRQYRVDGTLPADVEALIKVRIRTAGRPAAQPVTTESTSREASVPVTDAVAAEQPERDGSAVGSTPPGPPEHDGRIADLLAAVRRVRETRARMAAELEAFDRELAEALDQAEAELRAVRG